VEAVCLAMLHQVSLGVLLGQPPPLIVDVASIFVGVAQDDQPGAVDADLSILSRFAQRALRMRLPGSLIGQD